MATEVLERAAHQHRLMLNLLYKERTVDRYCCKKFVIGRIARDAAT